MLGRPCVFSTTSLKPSTLSDVPPRTAHFPRPCLPQSMGSQVGVGRARHHIFLLPFLAGGPGKSLCQNQSFGAHAGPHGVIPNLSSCQRQALPWPISPRAPLLKQESKAYYRLPSVSEQLKLPKRMLSEWSHTFLAFFDLVANLVPLTPGPRKKAESLSRYGYNNVLPTIRGRAVLLSPDLVRLLLSRHIVPRSRSIHVPLSLLSSPRRSNKYFPGLPS